MAEREPVVSRRGFKLSTFSFASVAACSMALTFVVLSAVRPSQGAPSASVKSKSNGDLALEIQRDMAFTTGTDATMGSPIISVANGGR